MKATTYQGDCLPILKSLHSNSVHAIITDPPAGIGFLGLQWDKNKGGRDAWINWLASIMKECHRVLKPGGHAIVWALPRTSHWTMTAIENSGFEIRDVVTHIFNSGVPPGGDLGKCVDRVLGVEPKVVGFRQTPSSTYYNGSQRDREIPILEAQSCEGKKWTGWSVKIKPGSEHWIIARKPLTETSVAKNLVKHGAGAVNIEACRVDSPRSKLQPDEGRRGRFPSNVVLSHDPRCDDNCHDVCKVAALNHDLENNAKEYYNTFYFCPKASKKERLEGTIHDKEK